MPSDWLWMKGSAEQPPYPHHTRTAAGTPPLPLTATLTSTLTITVTGVGTLHLLLQYLKSDLVTCNYHFTRYSAGYSHTIMSGITSSPRGPILQLVGLLAPAPLPDCVCDAQYIAFASTPWWTVCPVRARRPTFVLTTLTFTIP